MSKSFAGHVARGGNFTSFWAGARSEEFPCLATLALPLNAMTSSSIPVERLFSGASLKDRAHRSLMAAETLEAQVLIAHNVRALRHAGQWGAVRSRLIKTHSFWAFGKETEQEAVEHPVGEGAGPAADRGSVAADAGPLPNKKKRGRPRGAISRPWEKGKGEKNEKKSRRE